MKDRGTEKIIVFASKDTIGVKEGKPGKKIITIEFKNRGIAETLYNSEEYQAIIKRRQDSTKDG